ncbi:MULTISPECIES: hypothetical protein [unclassified Microcoleus]|uniref:hypothetical protein n=1 Tax=unclassified Microcoleus TaxID=2642155 RepID=UPI002FCF37A5
MENAEVKNSSDIEVLKQAADAGTEKVMQVLKKLSKNSLDIEALNEADAEIENLEPILKKLIALEKHKNAF